MRLLDARICEPLQLNNVTTRGLLLPISTGEETILVVGPSDALTAVFLDSEWTYHSEVIANLSNRRGLFIPDVLIRIDLDSMNGETAKLGSVVRAPGKYGIKTRRAPQGGGGFTQTIVVPIDTVSGESQQEDSTVAFTRWQLGYFIEATWNKLWEVDVSH